MAKDPATLWYWGDWSGGTSTMTRHLKGCYMDLLNAQFNNGHLSLDEIKTVLASDFGNAWPTLQKKFITDENGLFFNERAEIEKFKRQAFTKSRQDNLKSKSHKQPHMKKHMDAHMDNENEIINEDNFIMVSDEKVFDPMPILEFYGAQLNGTQKENGNIAWEPMVKGWFLEHIGEDFKDQLHVKNSFKKHYINHLKRGGLNGKTKSFDVMTVKINK